MSITTPQLKVGDELAFLNSGFCVKPTWTINAIERITASGRIECGGRVLNSDLTIRGCERGNPRRAYIATDEHRESIKRQDNLKIIQRIRFDELDATQLQQIVDAIREITKETRA